MSKNKNTAQDNRKIQELKVSLEKKQGNYFSNWSLKRLDTSLVMGLVFSLSLWLLADPKISSNVLSTIFLGMTIFVLIFQSIFCPRTLRKNTQYEDKKYEYSIEDLMLTMYRSGLILQNWSGDFYLFTTNNKILPNDHFVVRDYIAYCSILGQQESLRRLESQLFLSGKNEPNTKNHYHGETK